MITHITDACSKLIPKVDIKVSLLNNSFSNYDIMIKIITYSDTSRLSKAFFRFFIIPRLFSASFVSLRSSHSATSLASKLSLLLRKDFPKSSWVRKLFIIASLSLGAELWASLSIELLKVSIEWGVRVDELPPSDIPLRRRVFDPQLKETSILAI